MKKISKMKSSKLGSTSNGSSSSHPPIPVGSTLMNGKAKGVGTGGSSSGSSTSNHNGTSSISSAQDESNVKVIRDLSHIECNRYCFECGQRGPTYVDVTIGSFVCMTCSGLLRGITPPHRLKSISMASFTPEEMELLKNRGNEYCRKVWLATYTTKDTQLTSNDPDRLNGLKALMSSKYEQKRYYVDPSRLPKSDLAEIQGQNLKSINGGTPNKSPSTTSSPSPLLNNQIRSTLTEKGKSRLTSSVTLPDIKPLSSLLDPGQPMTFLHADLSSLSISSNSSSSSVTSTNRTIHNGNHHLPPPITYINNLANGNHPNSNNSSSNQFQLLTPWESMTSSSDSSEKMSEFNPNFADFDDAFSNKNGNNNNNGGSSNQQPQLSQKLMNGGFQFPNTTMQVPLIPNGEQNGFHHSTMETGTTSNGTGTFTGHPNFSAGDKYAALKDLDSLFKQHPDGASGTSPLQGSTLTSSMSVPGNLSSSSSSGQADPLNGWFGPASPSNQNPFSQVNGSNNGWTGGGTFTNGSGLNNGHSNPHNPFHHTNGGNNGWESSSTVYSGKNVNFGFHTPPSSKPQLPTTSHSIFRNDQPGLNPFAPTTQQPLKSNPNNPFL